MRSMTYAMHRRTVLQYQRTGHPSTFRTILTHGHVINVSNGFATLYRNVNDGVDKEDEDLGVIEDRDEQSAPYKKHAKCVVK